MESYSDKVDKIKECDLKYFKENYLKNKKGSEERVIFLEAERGRLLKLGDKTSIVGVEWAIKNIKSGLILGEIVINGASLEEFKDAIKEHNIEVV